MSGSFTNQARAAWTIFWGLSRIRSFSTSRVTRSGRCLLKPKSIFIFFFLLFIDHLYLNLGKGLHMNPLLAVWMPPIILGILGLYIFHLRAQNRDLPKLNLRGLRDAFASLRTVLHTRTAKARA